MNAENESSCEAINSENVDISIFVDESDELFIDGEKKKVEDITADFLENLVNKSLIDKVSYKIDSGNPIGSFISTMGTNVDSDLRKLYITTLKKDDELDIDDAGINACPLPED